MSLCYSAIPSRSLRRDGADLKGFGISQQVFCRAKFAFAQQSGAMKAPVELLSDRTVLRQQDGGALPRQARLTMHRMQTMQGKTRLSRRCAKTVQRPCKWRIKGKSHEESYDSSWDFGALEGTRIPGPLIKRIQGASFVKFQKFEETLFLSYHRETCLCTHRIICIQWNALQLLSSYSGVQKVCKNVQTGKTKPNGQINHRFYGRVQDIRTDTV